MGFLDRLRTVRRVMGRARRTPEIVRLLRRRPAILLGVSAYETALLASGAVDARLKALAQIKTSALVGCPF